MPRAGRDEFGDQRLGEQADVIVVVAGIAHRRGGGWDHAADADQLGVSRSGPLCHLVLPRRAGEDEHPQIGVLGPVHVDVTPVARLTPGRGATGTLAEHQRALLGRRESVRGRTQMGLVRSQQQAGDLGPPVRFGGQQPLTGRAAARTVSTRADVDAPVRWLSKARNIPSVCWKLRQATPPVSRSANRSTVALQASVMGDPAVLVTATTVASGSIRRSASRVSTEAPEAEVATTTVPGPQTGSSAFEARSETATTPRARSRAAATPPA